MKTLIAIFLLMPLLAGCSTFAFWDRDSAADEQLGLFEDETEVRAQSLLQEIELEEVQEDQREVQRQITDPLFPNNDELVS